MSTADRTIDVELSDSTPEDKKVLTIPIKHAQMMITLKNLLEDLDTDDDNTPIPLRNIDTKTFKKIAEFCKQKEGVKVFTDKDAEYWEQLHKEIDGWDKDFVNVDLETLITLMKAADFLNIQPLLQLTTKAMAEIVKNKSPDQLKAVFGVEGDFTEEEIAKANQTMKDLEICDPP